MNAGDYYGLAWHIAKEFGYLRKAKQLGIDPEDLIQDAMVRVVVCSKRYNPRIGKGSSLAWVAIHRQLRRGLKIGKRLLRERDVSSVTGSDSQWESETDFFDGIKSTTNEPSVILEKAEEEERLKVLIESLKRDHQNQYDVAKLILQGHTTSEIAEIRGCRSQSVAMVKARVIDKLKWAMGVC